MNVSSVCGVGGSFVAAEFTIEKVRGRVIRREPVLMQKKVVNFVWENELFDFDAAGAEARYEIDGLREVNVAIVVAVNEENGRFPGVDRSNGRGFMRKLGQLGRDVFAVPIVSWPIVNTVNVHTGGENVRVAAKAHRCEIA